MLILTISLSGYINAANATAPSADESSTASNNSYRNDPVRTYHGYDNSDSVQTGQSATKREYQYDSTVKSCRSVNGVWLRTGDRGYAACMDNSQTLKK